MTFEFSKRLSILTIQKRISKYLSLIFTNLHKYWFLELEANLNICENLKHIKDIDQKYEHVIYMNQRFFVTRCVSNETDHIRSSLMQIKEGIDLVFFSP